MNAVLQEWAKLARFGLLVVTLMLAAFGIAEGVFVWSVALDHTGTVGLDFTMYQERTESWLAGDGFYHAHQLAGPYRVEHGDSLYPPVLLLLTIPFSVGLPAVLWWGIPLVLVGASLRHARPPLWGWALLAATLAYPRTWIIILYGNPAMWALAFLAAGVTWRGLAALASLKLTLAPFALYGLRARSWWIMVGSASIVALPFGSMWIDYCTSLRYAETSEAFGLGYLLGEWPIAAALLVALGARTMWPPPRGGESQAW